MAYRENEKVWSNLNNESVLTLIWSFDSLADQVSRAADLSQPAVTASTSSDTERKETLEEGAEDDDGEPNAAELRRRRLRKLETSSSSPPPDNWSMIQTYCCGPIRPLNMDNLLWDALVLHCLSSLWLLPFTSLQLRRVGLASCRETRLS